MNLDRVVGKRVREARRAAGLTQAELAERCDVAPETIGRLERGTQMPTLDRLAKVAAAVGLDAADLIGRSVPNPSVARLLLLLRERSRAEAEMLADVAERIFAVRPTPRSPSKGRRRARSVPK